MPTPEDIRRAYQEGQKLQAERLRGSQKGKEPDPSLGESPGFGHELLQKIGADRILGIVPSACELYGPPEYYKAGIYLEEFTMEERSRWGIGSGKQTYSEATNQGWYSIAEKRDCYAVVKGRKPGCILFLELEPKLYTFWPKYIVLAYHNFSGSIKIEEPVRGSYYSRIYRSIRPVEVARMEIPSMIGEPSRDLVAANNNSQFHRQAGDFFDQKIIELLRQGKIPLS